MTDREKIQNVRMLLKNKAVKLEKLNNTPKKKEKSDCRESDLLQAS